MSRLFEKKGNIYLEFYDKFLKRSRNKSLRIKATRDGWVEARRFQKVFDQKHEELILESKFKFKKETELKLSNVFEEYKKKKAADNMDLEGSTIRAYELAIKHYIKACGNKKLYLYNTEDFLFFKEYLNTYTYNGKTLAEESKANYFRHLHAIFEFCKENGWVKENYIKELRLSKKPPKAIPEEDLKRIFEFLYNKKKSSNFSKPFDYKKWFNITYFLYISGFRKSTAIQLKWEDIDFSERLIYPYNKKGHRLFTFPMHDLMYEFLISLGPQQKGKIFGFSDTDRLKFFYRIQKEMGIEKPYSIHQLRKSFASIASKSKLADSDISVLLDHKDNGATAQQHYIERSYDRIRDDMNKMAFITVGDLGQRKAIIKAMGMTFRVFDN